MSEIKGIHIDRAFFRLEIPNEEKYKSFFNWLIYNLPKYNYDNSIPIGIYRNFCVKAYGELKKVPYNYTRFMDLVDILEEFFPKTINPEEDSYNKNKEMYETYQELIENVNL